MVRFPAFSRKRGRLAGRSSLRVSNNEIVAMIEVCLSPRIKGPADGIRLGGSTRPKEYLHSRVQSECLYKREVRIGRASYSLRRTIEYSL